MWDWALLGASWERMVIAAVASVVVLLWVIVVVRVVGLRSFAKMSSFDFAATIAIGSTMATVAVTGQPLVLGLVVVVVLLSTQAAVAWLRRRSPRARSFVDNRPLLLMVGEEFLDDNLAAVRVTRDDVRGKLREANVLDLSRLRAVVFESTGDISVLHGEAPLSPELLADVRDRHRVVPVP